MTTIRTNKVTGVNFLLSWKGNTECFLFCGIFREYRLWVEIGKSLINYPIPFFVSENMWNEWVY